MPEIPPQGRVICNLRSIMDERHLTVEDVARIAGLSRPTVRNLRTNRSMGVSLETVAKLCSFLRVGMGVLFTYKSRPELEFENQAVMGTDES
jgi:DNA-binding Xre family transcriptional regulator